ncbi:DUF1292 domain-containing protein [Rummeliibacillus pycnus]|uniref:DUF1292 domain-containing protein n=1 Tax=Rummeliibacillus pycnus TaxID=101070 RepID=UPI0037CA0CE2
MEEEFEQRHITIVDDEGNEQLCEVLHTFDSEEFGKSYVLYSVIGSEDEDGIVEIFASAFIPSEDGTDGELSPIETEEEWDFIESVIEELDEDIEAE